MNAKVADTWTITFPPAENADVEKALQEDGYPISNEGLRDWILDGIKYRNPDVIARAQRWIKENPAKVDAAKTLLQKIGRAAPFIFQTLRRRPPT
jgi:hypothetical protein